MCFYKTHCTDTVKRNTKYEQWVHVAVGLYCGIIFSLYNFLWFSDFLKCECIFSWPSFWTMQNNAAPRSPSLALAPPMCKLAALAPSKPFPAPHRAECAQQSKTSSMPNSCLTPLRTGAARALERDLWEDREQDNSLVVCEIKQVL